MSQTKKCCRCKNEKPLTEFGPDRRRKGDGLKVMCRGCDRELHWLRYHSDESSRKKTLESAKRSYHTLGRNRLRERRKAGLCYFCDSKAIEGTTRCEGHRKIALRRQPEYYQARYRRMKAAALQAYGNVCQCCGESNWKFLTIDHIDENGGEHRRSIFGKNAGNMLEWFHRNNFPPGYRTLCYNCNCARSRNGGICPHKEPQSDLLFVA
jgi:hypothetical protein